VLPRSGNCLSAEEGGQAAHLTSAVLADEGNHGGCWSGPLLDQLPDKEEVPYGGDGASEVLVSAPTGFFAGSPTCVDLSIKFQSAETMRSARRVIVASSPLSSWRVAKAVAATTTTGIG
jgi:hypothetical protein